MMQVTYILVRVKAAPKALHDVVDQAKSDQMPPYEVLDKGTTEPFPLESSLSPLLDDAKQLVCEALDSQLNQGCRIRLRVYTLNEPISSFTTLTMAQIKQELKDLSQTFLEEKALYWPRHSLMSELNLNKAQGQVIVALTIQQEKVPSGLPTVFEDEQKLTDHCREVLVELASCRACPPTGAKNSTMLEAQKPTAPEAVYNGRPIELTGPSTTIYHPVFATFKEKMAAPIDAFQISPEDLCLAYKIMRTSLKFYKYESERHSALKAYLPQAVDSTILDNQTINDRPARKFEVDGMGYATCKKFRDQDRAAAYFAELKNGIGEGSTDPIHQAECDYVLFCCADQRRLIRQSCCCPAFFIGIAGPNISVSGAVFTDRFVSQRLLSYVYLGEDPTVPGQLKEIARIFKVLKDCIAELVEYYAHLEPCRPSSTTPPRSQPGSLKRGASTGKFLLAKEPILGTYPHFEQFESNGKTVKLDYCGRLLPQESAKALFQALATTSNDDYQKQSRVVVKFTPTYCKEAHELLAEKGYAPKLWFCDYVKSVHMFVVVMDFVEDSSVDGPLSQEAAAALTEAISILHSRDLVFGDLRSPNIIIPKLGSGLRAAVLVDFDWCGKEGVVCYPVHVNIDEIIWPQGVSGCQLIMKTHDTTMLRRLTESSH